MHPPETWRRRKTDPLGKVGIRESAVRLEYPYYPAVNRLTLTPGHLAGEQRKILRTAALTYRRAKRAGKGQSEAVDAPIAEYRRLSPWTTCGISVSGEVNRMIAAAININPRWDCVTGTGRMREVYNTERHLLNVG
jgi:hypothetical protein